MPLELREKLLRTSLKRYLCKSYASILSIRIYIVHAQRAAMTISSQLKLKLLSSLLLVKVTAICTSSVWQLKLYLKLQLMQKVVHGM